jgi:hypothetical protein
MKLAGEIPERYGNQHPIITSTLIFHLEIILHLKVKEKEHFCSYFLAYRSSSKHIIVFMDDSDKNLKALE